MSAIKKLLALTIISLIGLLIVFTPSVVQADGCAIDIDGGIIAERGQKAVVIWDDDDGRETMILNASYGIESLSEFSWIIPIQSSSDPNVAEYKNNDYNDDAFEVMEELFPQLSRKYTWGSYYSGFSNMGTPGSSSVTVLDIQQIGVYELSTIEADDKDDLIDWLKAWNYTIPSGFSNLVDDYIDDNDGCYFVLNRINLEGVYQSELDALQSYKSSVYNDLMGDNLDNNLDNLVYALAVKIADDIDDSKAWSEVSYFVNYIMTEAKYIDLQNGSLGWGDLMDEVEEEIKGSDFFSTIYDLVDGTRGTPIVITFYPDEATYPLRISSIADNNGGIDVYFIGPDWAKDKNNMLTYWSSVALSNNEINNLEDELKVDIPSSCNYVSLLIYRGEMDKLTKDAIFINRGAHSNPSPSPYPYPYPYPYPTPYPYPQLYPTPFSYTNPFPINIFSTPMINIGLNLPFMGGLFGNFRNPIFNFGYNNFGYNYGVPSFNYNNFNYNFGIPNNFNYNFGIPNFNYSNYWPW